eukprot:TRINITY_DN92357_c0_g1_i1.p1 TRINITY_DN92357_c0_g1~~TRINITY_DN92357_c0_g1_i1.p1  ORF type:complete len:351 (+),score=47.22 TRINITY_DN92357_c0_g1_i1:35-1087(+)
MSTPRRTTMRKRPAAVLGSSSEPLPRRRLSMKSADVSAPPAAPAVRKLSAKVHARKQGRYSQKRVLKSRADEASFHSRVEELLAWSQANQKLPTRVDATVEERRLFTFVSDQLNAHKKGKLSKERRERLSAIPGMQRRLQHREEARYMKFDQQVEHLDSWVRAHGCRLPKQKKSDEEEARLARFLNKIQKQILTLQPERKEQLARVPGMPSLLEGWIARQSRPQSFAQSVEELKTWVIGSGGSWPKRSSNDVVEKRLSKFVDWQQYLQSYGQLSADRFSLLQAVPGMRWREQKSCYEVVALPKLGLGLERGQKYSQGQLYKLCGDDKTKLRQLKAALQNESFFRRVSEDA